MSTPKCSFCLELKCGGSAHECLKIVLPPLDNSAPRFVNSRGDAIAEKIADRRAKRLTRSYTRNGFSWLTVSDKQLEDSLNRRFNGNEYL